MNTVHHLVDTVHHLVDRARHHGLLASAAVSATALFLLALRMHWTGQPFFGFLVFNLLLAGIPVAAALLACALSGTRGRWLALPLLGLWLVFWPNSAYLVTDLVHLRSRSAMDHVFDTAMMASFAGAGCLLGLSALSLAEAAGRALVGRWPMRLTMPALLLLNGLGIYIGRFLRWNSWDLATRPERIAADLDELWFSAHFWGISGTYALVMGAAWLAFVSLRSPLPARPEPQVSRATA